MTGSIQMRHPIHGTTKAMILGAMALLALGCGKTAPPTELKVEVEKAPASASVAPVASTATEPAAPAAPASSAAAAPAASMAQAGNDAVDAVTSATTKLINSVQALAKKGQYVALVLQSKDTPDSRGMATTVRELAEASGKADCVMADVDDPAVHGLDHVHDQLDRLHVEDGAFAAGAGRFHHVAWNPYPER